MPRNTTFQNPQKQIVQTIEDQHKYDLATMRRLDVNASMTNRMETPYVGVSEASANASSAARLVEALNAPELKKFIQTKEDEYNKEETLRGEKEASAGNPADVTSKAFYQGYMKTKGYLGAMGDQEKMLKEWEETPKEGLTFGQWSQGWWQKNTAGLQDPEYLSGYMPVMTKVFSAAQQKDAQDKLKDVIENRNTALRDVIRQVSKEGSLADIKVWEAIRSSPAGKTMSPSEANEQLHKAAIEAADTGDVDTVMDITSLYDQKQSDGTPALGRFKGETDKLLLRAREVAHRKIKTQDDALQEELKQEFDDKFSEGFAGVLAGDIKLDDFMGGVTAHFKDHPQMGIQAMAELSGIIQRAGKREETAQMQLTFNTMLADVAEGKIKGREPIIAALRDGNISGSQASQLISSQRGFINAEKQLAAGSNQLKTQERQYMREAITQSLFAGLPADDKMFLGNEANLNFKQELAQVRLAFNQELNGVLGDHSKQQALLQSYQKTVRDIYTTYTFVPTVYDKAGIASLKATNPDLYRKHANYFIANPQELGKAPKK